jgi:PST family polysaccharide transporter
MNSSRRQILKSSAMIGSSSVLNILLGMARLKVAALILGPNGVGLIGLLQSFLSTGTAVGSLGVGQSGSRQVAAGRASDKEAAARRALFLATSILAMASAILVWALRTMIATKLLGDAVAGEAIGWMALGIGLSIVAWSQSGLLAGLGRVADVARVGIVTAILSTIATIGLLIWLREGAIIPYLLSVPVMGVLVGWYYAVKAPAPDRNAWRKDELFEQWRQLLGLGAALTVSGIVVNFAQLAVRSLIGDRLGFAELGFFQAAATVSITYLAFVLQAMGADFFPRLSALPAGSAEAERLINEQTEIGLLLGGPFILAMMGLAPWVLSLLYTAEFAGGAGVLRWQVLGDVLRLASWPLGFALLASGRGRRFVLLELVSFAVFLGATLLLLPEFGIEAAGIGFFVMHALYLPIVLIAVRARWNVHVIRDFTILFGIAAGVMLLAQWNAIAGAIAGPVFALALLTMAIGRLRDLLPETWKAKLGWR